MFVDFGKAFDRVPCKVRWWEMRTIGVEEWIILTVAAFYKFAGSKVRVNGKFKEEFGVKVGVHQGSVLSPLLFIIVMTALSRNFRTGCPWKLLYADDQVISTESINELVEIPSVEIWSRKPWFEIQLAEKEDYALQITWWQSQEGHTKVSMQCL